MEKQATATAKQELSTILSGAEPDGSIGYAFGQLVLTIFSDTTTTLTSISYMSISGGLRRRSGLPLKLTQGYVPVRLQQGSRNEAKKWRRYTTHATTTTKAGWVKYQAVARYMEFAHTKLQWCVAHKSQYEYACRVVWSNRLNKLNES
ncbi:hypothetical protein BC830DRAFT_1172087 [Chytriomyces sp. MP71]|nr:hypothetical protein BC830DRAFT_1172087 [Chytriomyces sp. MP71]